MSNLVEMKDVLKFLGLDIQSTEDKNLEAIRNAVEAWVQNYCNQIFPSATYRDRVDGTGTQELYLNHYPISSLYRLSIGNIDGINIKNSNEGAHASVSVNSTNLTLYKDGTVSTLVLATYTTLTTLTNAINTLSASGWSASLVSSKYGTYPSSCLLEQFGLQCINNRIVSLQIPDEAEYDFEVYSDEGRIFLWYGFPEGRRNIYVEYVAGYTTIPADLQLAVNILIKYMYQKRSEESFGLTNYSVSGISQSFESEGIPLQAREILDSKYRRWIVI